MRLFQSISGHSSELSIANHSSRLTVSELKCVSDIISNWLENHQPQKTKLSTVTNAPFIQNSNQMASRLTVTLSFPMIFSQLLQYLTQRPSLSAHRATLITKTDLTFPAFTFKFVDFAAQFCFHSKFSFHEERPSRVARARFDSSVIFLNQSLFFATHSNQWDNFILCR